jgi:hypothetical protein
MELLCCRSGGFPSGDNSPSGRVTAGVEDEEEEGVEEIWVVLLVRDGDWGRSSTGSQSAAGAAA